MAEELYGLGIRPMDGIVPITKKGRFLLKTNKKKNPKNQAKTKHRFNWENPLT